MPCDPRRPLGSLAGNPGAEIPRTRNRGGSALLKERGIELGSQGIGRPDRTHDPRGRVPRDPGLARVALDRAQELHGPGQCIRGLLHGFRKGKALAGFRHCAARRLLAPGHPPLCPGPSRGRDARGKGASCRRRTLPAKRHGKRLGRPQLRHSRTGIRLRHPCGSGTPWPRGRGPPWSIRAFSSGREGREEPPGREPRDREPIPVVATAGLPRRASWETRAVGRTTAAGSLLAGSQLGRLTRSGATFTTSGGKSWERGGAASGKIRRGRGIQMPAQAEGVRRGALAEDESLWVRGLGRPQP